MTDATPKKDLFPQSPQPQIVQEDSKVADIKNVFEKLKTYENIIPTNLNVFDKFLIQTESVGAMLELATKNFREVLPDDKIEILTKSINKLFERSQKLEIDATKRDTIKLNAAKLEAAVKGFELPLVYGGPFGELELFSLEQTEVLEVPLKAVKQAILEVSGKSIKKEDYADHIINHSMAILEQDPQHDADKIFEFRKFITQGNKVVKLEDGNYKAREKSAINDEVRTAVEQSADKFINYINEKVDQISAIEEIIQPINKVQVADDLSKLDSRYLQQNKEVIAQELQSIAQTGTSFWEKIKSIFTQKDYLAERLTKIVLDHEPKSIQYASEHRSPTIPQPDVAISPPSNTPPFINKTTEITKL